MAFDLLYLNGESLVKKTLKERRSLLHSSFNEIESKFMFAQYRDGDTAETMQEFLDESVKGNNFFSFFSVHFFTVDSIDNYRFKSCSYKLLFSFLYVFVYLPVFLNLFLSRQL